VLPARTTPAPGMPVRVTAIPICGRSPRVSLHLPQVRNPARPGCCGSLSAAPSGWSPAASGGAGRAATTRGARLRATARSCGGSRSTSRWRRRTAGRPRGPAGRRPTTHLAFDLRGGLDQPVNRPVALVVRRTATSGGQLAGRLDRPRGDQREQHPLGWASRRVSASTPVQQAVQPEGAPQPVRAPRSPPAAGRTRIADPARHRW
jgi:hypothetical protein